MICAIACTHDAGITVIIPGEPCAKGRPRIGKNRSGHAMAFTPAKTRSREGVVASLGMDAMKGCPPLQGPLCIRVDATMGVPKSWPKRDKKDALDGVLLPTKRPDLDNIVKLVKDALNGIAWADDSQVVKLFAKKIYGEIPQTVVQIFSLQDDKND